MGERPGVGLLWAIENRNPGSKGFSREALTHGSNA